MQIKEYQEHFWVEFDNAVSIEIYTDEKNCGGFGRVKCGRTDVRCDDLPILPLVSTVDGYQARHLELEEVIQEEEEQTVTVTFRPYIGICGHVDPAGRTGGPQWNVSAWHQEPERDRGGQLRLELKELNRTIGGIEMRGFSYAYKFRSRRFHPLRIHDRSTWELAGSATRNELILRGQHCAPRKSIANKKAEFSSAWRRDGELVAQFRPLFTELQGFTYQYDKHNILLTTFEDLVDCRSLVQKDAGNNYIVQWHQLTGEHSPNGSSLETTAHQVLCADLEEEGEAARLNEYESIRTELQAEIRDRFDVPDQQALSSGLLKLEIWHRSDEVHRGIEKLGDVGCQEVIIPDLLFQELLAGRIGPGRPIVPDDVAEKVAEAADNIHRRVMEAAMRVHVSVLLAEASEGEVMPGERELEAWVEAFNERLDLDAIYLVNALAEGEPEVPPTLESCHGHAPLEVEATFHRVGRRAGLRTGGSGFGAFSPCVQAVPFESVRDNEFLYRDTVMEFPYVEVIEGKDKPKEAYFRGFANRLCYGIPFGSDDGERPELPDWYENEFIAINTAFCAVSEYMQIPRLLEEGRGVMWSSSEGEDAVRVLWAYDEFSLEVGEEAQIYDVMGAHLMEMDEEERELKTESHRVYMIQNAPEL
jgi:hypothetical protein